MTASFERTRNEEQSVILFEKVTSLVRSVATVLQFTIYFRLFLACRRLRRIHKSNPKEVIAMPEKEETTRRKKESIVDLSRFIDKKVRVKFQGGREASGILKGYDALINLVLDNAVEYVRDTEDPQKVTEETRQLGLIVARGTAITVVAPNDGIEQIANPFV
uniref:U6 snRNA-associated Sm-like protein LSm7 n=1 Tax=Setaria digitata TaxID=48799 RepID=A0A915PI49_9BILA